MYVYYRIWNLKTNVPVFFLKKLEPVERRLELMTSSDQKNPVVNVELGFSAHRWLLSSR
jgi:hypothetical protein